MYTWFHFESLCIAAAVIIISFPSSCKMMYVPLAESDTSNTLPATEKMVKDVLSKAARYSYVLLGYIAIYCLVILLYLLLFCITAICE